MVTLMTRHALIGLPDWILTETLLSPGGLADTAGFALGGPAQEERERKAGSPKAWIEFKSMAEYQ